MNQLPARADENQIASAIHLEFIRTVVEANNGSGIDEVEAFHRALFLNQHGKDLERFQQQRRTLEERLGTLEKRLGQIVEKLSNEATLVPVNEDGKPDIQPNPPWNLWDRAMFAASGLAILCLLVFGVLNVSFNLLESGIVTFAENPVRAYFWAALLPVGALAVKVGWDFLESARRRRLYLWTCLAAGVLGVAIWVAAYASIYPTFSKTIDDQISSLSVFDESPSGSGTLSTLTIGGAKWIDMILVGAQAMAEICLSAALGMYMTQLYARHRPVRLARNPAYSQLEEDRRALDETITRDRLALAEAKGDEARLTNQLAVFVAYARSLYQRELALRHDRSHQKRLLLDDIAEQLRARLEAVEKAGNPANDVELPRLEPLRGGAR